MGLIDIFKPEVLLTELQRIIEKNRKPKIISKEIDSNIQITMK